MQPTNKSHWYQPALDLHSSGEKGKIGTRILKPLNSPADLALAYSPGVAAPCLEIHRNPVDAYEYTAKGNLVAVISNGTAVLGLGNIGALASKPVMEGKAALFKKFADVDSVDLEVDTEDPQEFINAIKLLASTWGGINLEDIKAPECFVIEKQLQQLLEIPVFHDDQHGTAIIASAAMLNAASITGKKLSTMKVVVNGAGAAGISCVEMLKHMGISAQNIVLCDTKGVIHHGRTDGMNEWKQAHATSLPHRTLAEATKGADMFLGLSVKGALSKEMVKSMADNPIIFAMANPDPEITPDEVKEVRSDAIIATGRSDLPNQVNNVMCFPYIFRGALDVRAKCINIEMKVAAAHAIAELAKQPALPEMQTIYQKEMEFGVNYILPVPFDYRLLALVPYAVAEAAINSGVATHPNFDLAAYREHLSKLASNRK